MTKTERQRRARSVRRHIGLFVSWQTDNMREYLAGRGVDPDVAGLAQLIDARVELDGLIAELTAERVARAEARLKP
jgi:DNA-binding FadR family transcriptional regulator